MIPPPRERADDALAGGWTALVGDVEVLVETCRCTAGLDPQKVGDTWANELATQLTGA